MPSASRFILKDSPPAIKAVAGDKGVRGRRYDYERAKDSGGVKATEVLFGVQMACLSITDDEPGTLAKVGKMNPWQLEALEIITGSEEGAHAPLSEILKTKFNLEIDHMMNVSGMSKAGHLLDTQGFIAHNDSTIVLSYRCTTSVADWLTNLTTTSSAWEIEPDVAQGHSGFLSCFCDYRICTQADDVKPRVHTGFYNNFLVTVPLIRQYIDPLLAPGEPPRMLYVVGHSLGAGVAAMAACYFLLENYDWKLSPHKLRVVTLGGPRSCCKSMANLVNEKLRELRRTDKAVFARVVRDKDGVPKVPPAWLGFAHIEEKPVYLTKENEKGVSSVLINPNLKLVVPTRTMKRLIEEDPTLLGTGEMDADQMRTVLDSDSDGEDDEDDDNKDMTRDAKEAQRAVTTDGSDQSLYRKVPRSLRDHMPEFYLNPLYALVQREQLEVGREEKEIKRKEQSETPDMCFDSFADHGIFIPHVFRR